MAAFVELFIDQGTTFTNVINLTDDLSNAAINAANYTVTSQIKRSYYSVNAAANITCTISNASNGEITLSMTAGQTANIKPGRYLFDVKTVDQANTVSRVLEGIINILPQVTK